MSSTDAAMEIDYGPLLRTVEKELMYEPNYHEQQLQQTHGMGLLLGLFRSLPESPCNRV